ncbi:MAG: universal stress protein [Chitinophagaceae bacterium]
MKTILVPTDFSSAAANAARYAADFANSINAEKIILYNAYAMPIATEMTWALMESEQLKQASQSGLDALKMVLRPFCDPAIAIETMADFGFFSQRINDASEEMHVDIVIMGITGSGGLERVFFGSSALTAVHNTKLPLLIVPPEATWHGVDKIAWACDFHNVQETTPLHIIHDLLELTKAQLHVLHSNNHVKDFDPEMVQENIYLHKFFKDKPFEFALLTEADLSEAISKYVFENGIDWLIVVPKKHSWLHHLFTKNHTKELAFHTHVPMLCLQQ